QQHKIFVKEQTPPSKMVAAAEARKRGRLGVSLSTWSSSGEPWELGPVPMRFSERCSDGDFFVTGRLNSMLPCLPTISNSDWMIRTSFFSLRFFAPSDDNL